jgi:hypothetical protein
LFHGLFSSVMDLNGLRHAAEATASCPASTGFVNFRMGTDEGSMKTGAATVASTSRRPPCVRPHAASRVEDCAIDGDLEWRWQPVDTPLLPGVGPKGPENDGQPHGRRGEKELAGDHAEHRARHTAGSFQTPSRRSR